MNERVQPVHDTQQDLGAQILPMRRREAGLAVAGIESPIDAGIRMVGQECLQPGFALLGRPRRQQWVQQRIVPPCLTSHYAQTLHSTRRRAKAALIATRGILFRRAEESQEISRKARGGGNPRGASASPPFRMEIR